MVTGTKSRLLPNTSLVISPSTTHPLGMRLFMNLSTYMQLIDLIIYRAGANFSAISGNDNNALRWDREGYLSMWALVDSGEPEAKYLKKTKSTEYFDMVPDSNKITSMKQYLNDVGIAGQYILQYANC